MPDKVLDDDPNVAGTQSDRWWTFRWGPNKNSLVTEDAITPMLERFNKDFKYFREDMGWPRICAPATGTRAPYTCLDPA